MGIYSELVLLLFTPYRAHGDIQDSLGSFTLQLRKVHSQGGISDEAIQFLQNVQDVKSNCFRACHSDDPLQRTTEPFMPADSAFDQQQNSEEDENNDDPDREGAELDVFLELLGEGIADNEAGKESGCVLPQSLNLEPMRQKGVHDAAYKHLAKMQTTNPVNTAAFEPTGDSYVQQEETDGGQAKC